MVYLIAASVRCAIYAVNEGGAANSTMLFSVAITYGCKFFLFPLSELKVWMQCTDSAASLPLIHGI